jgi:RNA polymerase sigma-B factor
MPKPGNFQGSGILMAEFSNLQQDPEELVSRFLANPRPDLKDVIMVQYAGLVERTARKFSGVEAYDDLVSVGYIGLLNALTKFDPTAGVRFNTYATYLVAGEIKHYLRDRSQTIRQPAWLQELRTKVTRAASSLQQGLGRLPSEREIADEVGVTEASVREVYSTQEMLRVGSLDQPGPGEDEGSSEAEKLDAADFCPEQLSLEDRLLLETAMRQLRDLERQVLVLFHFEALNQTEIANRLGISCNYVSHILRQSLAKLRKILTTEENKDRVLRQQEEPSAYEITDPVTGAYTERYFRTRLKEEMHRASFDASSVAIVLVQFNGLEGLRRFYGEQSVTDFLADASEFFKDNVRRLDVVARYGESGFGIVLPYGARNVAVVHQRLLAKTKAWTLGRLGPNGAVNIEVGQACSPADGKSAEALLKSAVLRPAESIEFHSLAA